MIFHFVVALIAPRRGREANALRCAAMVRGIRGTRAVTFGSGSADDITLSKPNAGTIGFLRILDATGLDA